jgi:hypothetical protein
MKPYTVKLNGKPIKTFTTLVEAQKFMVIVQMDQQEKLKALAYIDEAVLKSDLRESNELLSYIMEKVKYGT